jgi:hypothetical protein
MKALFVLCVGLAALGVVGASPGMQAADVVVVKLKPVNKSGVTGTATLTHLAGERTRVVIVLAKREPGKLPAHLHFGPCKVVNSDVKAGLSDVVRGRSVTTLDLPTWTEIRHATLSVHVHVPSFYLIACGELPRAS